MRRELYLLDVSESAAEAAEISRLLKEAGYEIHVDHVTNAGQLGTIFAASIKPEVLIIHHPALPARRDGTLKILQDYAANLACIVIGPEFNADTVEFMKAGACDFILARDLSRIGAVVDAALKKAPRSAGRDRLEKALKLSEEKYHNVFKISPDSININRLQDGVYLDVSDGFTRILGYSREEVLGRSSKPGDLCIWVNGIDRERLVDGLKAKGEVIGFEAQFRTKEGRVVTGLMSARILRVDGVDCVLSYTREITERRRMEDELRKLSRAVEQTPLSIVITDLTGTIEYVNGGFTRETGYSADEARGRKTNILKSGSMPPANYEELWRTITAGREWQGEFHNKKKNGELFWEDATVSAIKDPAGRITHFLAIKENFTARKEAEQASAATIRLLRLCNQSSDTRTLAKELTLFFKELTDCDTVGLRLRDANDFPYFETRGFAHEFVQGESRLCGSASDGKPECDAAGHPVLTCMCGNVLSGRTDPEKPFFTAHGSFWTNSTTELLASTTEQDRQGRTRNHCDRDGYETIALIPLKNSRKVLGLLQLNHRQKNRFTAERITFLEGLAEYVTTAIEKLESEQALRSSEEHLRQVLKTSEAGYFLLDTAGLYRDVNDAWLRLYGYERAEEILGRHYSTTLTDADEGRAGADLAKMLSGAPIPTRELCRRRKDGSVGYHTFSAHVVREQGRIAGLEGFLIDTTGLRKIEKQYAMLFDQMLDGFALHEMVFDADGNPSDYRFLAINPAFEQMTGLKSASTVGRRVREVMPVLESKWLEIYGQVVRSGEPCRFEDFSAELGKYFDVMVFRPQAGQFACLVRDISSRKQLEFQLLQSQKMEAIGQLAGGIAHDFNNILAAIMMHLGLLLRRPGLMRDMKESLGELEAEAKRAASLTRQLLLFSRRQSMHFCATDLNDLLSNLLKMLRRLISEHVKLVFNSGHEPLWIEADPGMIEQVVVNLCVNARDAMPKGGDLKIETYAAALSATEILGDSQSRTGNFVCLAVSDNGIGIDAETLKHIYEPFFTTKEAGKGTGLGLATVYSIVKQHGGWINVHSTAGKGTTFRIFIPAGNTPSPTVAKADQVPITGGSEGVLVVEDDAGFRSMLTMSLKILGYQVFEADNGKNAMIVWAEHSAEIGLLLADLVMPGGTSGIELCHRLALEKPALRMIVTTGYGAERVDLTELTSEGISFLPKPFSAATLAAVVRHSFDQAAPDAASARPSQP